MDSVLFEDGNDSIDSYSVYDDTVLLERLDVLGEKLDSMISSMEVQVDAVERGNDIETGIVYFIGILFGVILLKILWDRFK